MSEIKQKIRDMIKEEIKNLKSEKPKTNKKPVIKETKKQIKEATTETIDGILVVTNTNGKVELHLPMGMTGDQLKRWLAKHPDIDKKWSKK